MGHPNYWFALFCVYEGNELENKGILFKVRWFVRPDINTGATII